jgi:putative addiction module component (TIGR02574 family)
MSENAEIILKQVLTLSPKDRAKLVEKILASLDQPDPAIDALWAQEAEDRIDAYDAGELEAIPAEEVLKKYKQT